MKRNQAIASLFLPHLLAAVHDIVLAVFFNEIEQIRAFAFGTLGLLFLFEHDIHEAATAPLEDQGGHLRGAAGGPNHLSVSLREFR